MLEGLDGSGKTTVINRLKEDFPHFVFTREPGGSPFGERMRSVLLDNVSTTVPPLPMLLGFMASRASNYQETIVPARNNGSMVVSDRFDASTYAFQLFAQEDRSLLNLFWNLRTEILSSGPHMPRYIYLRLSEGEADRRRKNRKGNNHFDIQTSDYHRRVFKGYEEFFETITFLSKQPRSKELEPCIIDADQDTESVYKAVHSYICSQITS